MIKLSDFEALDSLSKYCDSSDLPCPEYTSIDDSLTPDSSSTLLDTIETSDSGDGSVSYRGSIDQFHDSEYARILEAYGEFDISHGGSHIEQLLSCRTLAWFARHETTGEVKIISRKCGLRWCPVCQDSKQAFITHEVSTWLRMFKHPKILTLTMRHTDEPLDKQVSDIYEAFRTLRRRKFFNSKVTGGIWFFQIKKSKTDGLWHPHIHCLITGLFVPREKLSDIWLQITGDSPVCDIRAVKCPDTAVRHVARYASSPANLADLSTPEITELIESLHGRRIVGTWGKARSISLSPKSQFDKDLWINLGSYNTVVGMLDVDTNAKQILHAYKTNTPLPAGVSMIRVEQLFVDKVSGPPPPREEPYLTGFYEN